jgi:hypothetical protein
MTLKELSSIAKNLIRNVDYSISIYYPFDIIRLRYAKILHIGDSPFDLCYCLEEKNGKWEVYYLERNCKFELIAFENESEACEYFYSLLMKYINKKVEK